MIKRKKFSFSIILFLISLLFFGCDSGVQNQTGDLVVHLTNNVRSTQVDPDIEIDVDYYTIAGSGPNEALFFEDDITGDSFTQENLLVGEWTITVNAYNENDDILGSGHDTITIVEDDEVDLAIDIEERDENGSLSFYISWNSEDWTDPVISAKYVLFEGDFGEGFTNLDQIVYTDLTLVSAGETSVSCSKVLAPGSYVVMVEVSDDNDSWQEIYTVRIFSDATSSFTEAVTLEEPIVGELNLTINNNIISPFSLKVMPDDEEEYALGATTLFTATAKDIQSQLPVILDKYFWFLNGEYITANETNTYTLSDTLESGDYEIIVIGFIDGIISMDETCFSIVEE